MSVTEAEQRQARTRDFSERSAATRVGMVPTMEGAMTTNPNKDRKRVQDAPPTVPPREPPANKEREAKARNATENTEAEEERTREERLNEARARPDVQINVIRHHIRRLYQICGIATMPGDMTPDQDLELDDDVIDALEDQPSLSELIDKKGGGPGGRIDEEDVRFRQGKQDATLNYRGIRTKPRKVDYADQQEGDPRTGERGKRAEGA